jgi:hypothetical protein
LHALAFFARSVFSARSVPPRRETRWKIWQIVKFPTEHFRIPRLTLSPVTEGSLNPSNADRTPVEIDSSVAHASRVYDYFLGGTDNFAVDREAAEALGAAIGGIANARSDVRANRDFLGRAVRYLVLEAGIRQFLDIGTGVPNADNTHAVAQELAPETRIVYVDNDPIVLAHAHSLLKSTDEGSTAYLDGDLREPDRILGQAAKTLDFTEPIAIMLVSIMHFIGDQEDPTGIIGRLLNAVPGGSYLALSHLSNDIQAKEELGAVDRLSAATRETFYLRSHADVSRFFDSLGLVEPGVVQVAQWRNPDPDPPGTRVAPFYGGVGRKP